MSLPAAEYFPAVRPPFWRTFVALFLIGLFGIAMGLPYIFGLLRNFASLAKEPLPFSFTTLQVLQTVQLCVYVAIAVGVGRYASDRIGTGAPLIESWLVGEPVQPKLRRMLLPSLITGVIVGIVALVLLLFVFIPLVPDLTKLFDPSIPIWKKFLASFYGGIVEEIMMRFFLVSLFAWLLARLIRRMTVAFWIASFVVALIFGLGHLGAASLMTSITATVVIGALVLNGIAALAFSYLYRRFGLESAMIAHFTADIVLHVVGSVVR